MFISQEHKEYFESKDSIEKVEAHGDFFIEDYPSSTYPYVKFPVEFPHEIMLEEYNKVKHLLIEHQNRNSNVNPNEICYANGWYGLTIHGLGPDKLEGNKAYGVDSTDSYRWFFEEELSSTISFIKSLPYTNFMRIRYMIMKPRSYILPHTDYNHMWLSPLNLSITNPDGCRFAFAGYEDVPFKPGIGFLMNIGRQHMVYNDSDEERVHMIIHGKLNSDFINSIASSL